MANDDGSGPRLVAVGVRPTAPALSMLACDATLSLDMLGKFGPSTVPEPLNPGCVVREKGEKGIALLVVDPRSPPRTALESVVTVPGDT